MKLRTVFVSCLVATTVFASGGAVLSVPVEDEQIPTPLGSTTGLHGVEMNEVSGLRENVSVLVGKDSSGTDRICTSTSDSSCSSDVGNGYYFRSVLEPCSVTIVVDCIDSVSAAVNGVTTRGVFEQMFPLRGTTDFQDSASDGIPNGSTPSLWNFASIPHAFGSQYEVTVQVVGSKVNGDTLKPQRTFFANITPVSIAPVRCTTASNGHCMDTFYEDPSTGKIQFAGVAADQDAGVRCQNWGENSRCALKHAFPAGVEFTLKVRLRSVPDGWLHGRMTNPSASISTVGGVTTISVTAAPTKVAVAAAAVDWSALSAPLQAWFDNECLIRCGTRRPDTRGLPGPQRNAIANPTSYSESSFTQLALWRDIMKDKAYAVPSVWNVRTLSYAEMQKAPACIKNGDGVTGIVSTNATLYAEGPPAFNVDQSTLDYKVASLHYEKDGTTPFLGQYSLLLRDDIAKCLYGAPAFSSTSSVSVIAENGSPAVASTSFANADGWLRFVASGYTHSAPVVKVKLSPKWPTVRTGRKLSLSTIAKTYGMSVSSKATVTAKVSSQSSKVCSVSGGAIVGKRKGTCMVKISVKPAPTKKVARPKTVSQTVKVVIS